jgi:hypothetical protein
MPAATLTINVIAPASVVGQLVKSRVKASAEEIVRT